MKLTKPSDSRCMCGCPAAITGVYNEQKSTDFSQQVLSLKIPIAISFTDTSCWKKYLVLLRSP